MAGNRKPIEGYDPLRMCVLLFACDNLDKVYVDGIFHGSVTRTSLERIHKALNNAHLFGFPAFAVPEDSDNGDAVFSCARFDNGYTFKVTIPVKDIASIHKKSLKDIRKKK